MFLRKLVFILAVINNRNNAVKIIIGTNRSAGRRLDAKIIKRIITIRPLIISLIVLLLLFKIFESVNLYYKIR